MVGVRGLAGPLQQLLQSWLRRGLEAVRGLLQWEEVRREIYMGQVVRGQQSRQWRLQQRQAIPTTRQKYC